MYCDAATVAYRQVGVNPETGKNYQPWMYSQYRDDEHLIRTFEHCPCGSEPLLIPCGRCLLCSRRYRLHWALRCSHELRQHDASCFLTLTVNSDSIGSVFPPATSAELNDRLHTDFYDVDSKIPSLRHKPFQDFMKRLRRSLDYRGFDSKLRYFMCGEYGDKSLRPHYHSVIFGFNPSDRVPLPGKPGLFVSPFVSKLWPYGFHIIEDTCENNISYVAGYCDKKMERRRIDWLRSYSMMPEYVAMSRRPGIGGDFFDRYCDSDLYPQNADGSFLRHFALLGRNRKVKMPRYYDDLLFLRDPEKYDKLIASRRVAVDEIELDVRKWLNESHRKEAVAATRRRTRDPGVAELV